MHRILIIGLSGAGKTTFAIRLGRRLRIPVTHLDRIFWKPGWSPTPLRQFIRAIRIPLSRPRWIIDGNYASTLRQRLRHADTIIFMDYSRWRCMTNVLRRILRYHGQTRPDMAPDCPERFDRHFLTWVWRFHSTDRPRIIELLSHLRSNQRRIDFHRPIEAERFLDSLD